jgi:Protein of unknown function (DUF4232)
VAPPSRHRTVSFTSAVLVAALAVVVGFGGGWLARRDAVTPTPTTLATPPATSGQTTSSTAVRASACIGSGLSGAFVSSSGAAGTVQTTFTVTNVGAGPCTLDGSPELQLLNANRVVMTSTTADGGGGFTPAAANLPAKTLRLSPGGAATFVIQFSNVPAGQSACPEAASLNVFPPSSSTAFDLTYSFAPCDGGTVDVSPFFTTT